MNLEELVEQERFLPDLYYRINVFPIHLPPLRERKKDIPLLVFHIIRKLNQEYGRSVEGISQEALKILISYDWPGNIRELENVLGRAMINMDIDERIIEPHHLPPLELSKKGESFTKRGTLKELLREYERKVIMDALKRTQGNRMKAAKLLGIGLRTLYYKMEKLGIK